MLFASASRPSDVSHLSTCPTVSCDSHVSSRGERQAKVQPRGRCCALWGTWMLGTAILLLAGLGWTAPIATAQQATAHFLSAQTVVAKSPVTPEGVAVDAAGNLYVADSNTNEVQKVPFTGGEYGIATTVVSGLNGPMSVAVNASGTKLYVADTKNNQVLEETLSGSTYTQTAVVLSNSTMVNGQTLMSPQGLAVDVLGNVYIADTENSRVLKVMCNSGSCGAPTVVADNSAGLPHPVGVAVDGTGNVYIVDWVAKLWVKESWNSIIYTKTYTSAQFASGPTGIAVDSKGNVYFAGWDAKNVTMAAYTSGDLYADSISISGSVEFPYMLPKGIAVDTSGGIFITDDVSGNVAKLTLSTGAKFRSVDIGTSNSAPATLNFTFDTAGTIGTPLVSTQGAPNLDFVDAGTGSCTTKGTSHSYSIGDTCSVRVTFHPKFVGARYGGVVLSDSTGKAIATGYVSGTGVGPQLSFSPATQSTLAVGPDADLRGVAADGSGNVFFTDINNQTVNKIPVGCTTFDCVKTLSSAVAGPAGVAVDGSGNVFFTAVTTHTVNEIPVGCVTVDCIKTLSSAFTLPNGVAVDGSGNLYVADGGAATHAVSEILAASGYTTVRLLSAAFSEPVGVAVDGSGNVFVADRGNSAVKEIVAANSTVGTLRGDLGEVVGVAVDRSGNVFVASAGNSQLTELLVIGDYTTVKTVGPFTFPTRVAIDGSGKLFIADRDTSSMITTLDSAEAPSLHFEPTAVGSISSDSPQILTLRNVGNADLSFSIPTGGMKNPAMGADFSLNTSGGNACMVISNDTGPVNLLAGDSCQFSVHFEPVAAGNLTESLTLTDSNLNVVGSTQTVNLSGTANSSVATITLGNLNQTYSGWPEAATVSTSPDSLKVSITYDDGLTTAATTTAPTNAGTYTVKATVIDPGYTATQTATLVIAKATPAITFAVASHTFGDAPFTVGASTKSTGALLYSVVSGPATISGSTVTLTGAGMVLLLASQVADSNYTVGTTNATFTVAVGAPSLTLAVTGHTYGDAPFTVSASTKSTGALLYSVVSGPATISGSTVTLTGAGTVVLLATQAADSNNTATSTNATFTVAARTPSLIFNVPEHAYGDVPFTVSARSNSAGAFIYTVVSGPATISGSTVTLAGAGTVVLIANQVASGNYAAGSATTTFVVTVSMTLTTGTGSGSATGSDPATATMTKGAATAIPLKFTPGGGGTYPNALTLSVLGLPPGATSTFAPASIPAGSAATPITLIIGSIAGTARNENPFSGKPFAPLALGFLLLPLAGLKSVRRHLSQMPRLPLMLIVLVLSMGATLGLSGCGSHDRAATNYTLVITATDAITGTHSSTNVTLAVK